MYHVCDVISSLVNMLLQDRKKALEEIRKDVRDVSRVVQNKGVLNAIKRF